MLVREWKYLQRVRKIVKTKFHSEEKRKNRFQKTLTPRKVLSLKKGENVSPLSTPLIHFPLFFQLFYLTQTRFLISVCRFLHFNLNQFNKFHLIKLPETIRKRIYKVFKNISF